LAASEASASAQPAMPASGFEISCATPETTWPRNATRSSAIACISRWRCAVMSSNIESTWLVWLPRRTGRRLTW
jgi:hypothetical protein